MISRIFLYKIDSISMIRSGQITIIPKPECFGHFGGILLLFTTILFGVTYSAGKVSIICPDKMPGMHKTL